MSDDKTFKKSWVEMFEQIGLDEPTMKRWHAIFEERWPERHDSFLGWLGLGDDEVARIRASSRGDLAAGE